MARNSARCHIFNTQAASICFSRWSGQGCAYRFTQLKLLAARPGRNSFSLCLQYIATEDRARLALHRVRFDASPRQQMATTCNHQKLIRKRALHLPNTTTLALSSLTELDLPANRLQPFIPKFLSFVYYFHRSFFFFELFLGPSGNFSRLKPWS